MGKQLRIAIALDLVEPYPHHQNVFKGAMRYAREHDWACQIDEHPGYRSRQRKGRQTTYDGVIARANHVMQRRLSHAGVPFVNTVYGYARPGIAGVYLDPAGMGTIAADHLIERGFHRLYVVYPDSSAIASDIAKGFINAAVQEEISCRGFFYPEGDTLDHGYWLSLERNIENWLSKIEFPAGIFVSSPIVARMLVTIAQELGVSVPQDFAVLCRQSVPLMMEVDKQISAVKDCSDKIGYEAASLLHRLIEGEPVPKRPLMITPTGVIARESTDYYAVEDDLVAEALRYISQNLRGSINVDDVAYTLAVSVKTLQNRFDKALGRGVAGEIRRLRLSAAKVILAEHGISIEIVAKRTGFKSADVMARAFRREFGMSPSEYRNTL